MFTIISISCLVLVGASCRRSDIKTVVVNVPEMQNRACAKLIVDRLSREMGVKGGTNIKVDLAARTITVQYESILTAKKNVEYAVAKVGFSANSIPANKDAAAKLPSECLVSESSIMIPNQQK